MAWKPEAAALLAMLAALALGCQPGDLLFYKANGAARAGGKKKSEPKK